MDPLSQMETGNSTSELGDLRQNFCDERERPKEMKVLPDSLPAQETGVANSHVGTISGPGSDTSNFFLDRLGSTPLFVLGK